MALDEPVIVAVAALAGSLVGACSSLAATFIGQRLQARWTQPRTELEDRERLYGIFVEESVHLFADSIQRSAIEPAKIMRLYSKVARIRLASTDQVLHAAEEVGKRLLEAYEKAARKSSGSSRAIRQWRRQPRSLTRVYRSLPARKSQGSSAGLITAERNCLKAEPGRGRR
jgi:hypothetical protein